MALLTLAGVAVMFAAPAFELPETVLRSKQAADHLAWGLLAAMLLVAFHLQPRRVADGAAVKEVHFLQPDLLDLTCARLC